jgi:hypothetical protein
VGIVAEPDPEFRARNHGTLDFGPYWGERFLWQEPADLDGRLSAFRFGGAEAVGDELVDNRGARQRTTVDMGGRFSHLRPCKSARQGTMIVP